MLINKYYIETIFQDEALAKKILKMKTYENLFDMTLAEFKNYTNVQSKRELGRLLQNFTIYNFYTFKDSKLANSFINMMEQNQEDRFGETFSHYILKAMKAHFNVLTEKDKINFLSLCDGGSVGYMLAGGLYWYDVIDEYIDEDIIKKTYPEIYKTSYVAYNLGGQHNYNYFLLRNGCQYEGLEGYLQECKKARKPEERE